jgi:hypothetical protein
VPSLSLLPRRSEDERSAARVRIWPFSSIRCAPNVRFAPEAADPQICSARPMQFARSAPTATTRGTRSQKIVVWHRKSWPVVAGERYRLSPHHANLRYSFRLSAWPSILRKNLSVESHQPRALQCLCRLEDGLTSVTSAPSKRNIAITRSRTAPLRSSCTAQSPCISSSRRT